MDGEKVIKELEHLLNKARGNYLDFADVTVDFGEEILALLKEQEKLNQFVIQLTQKAVECCKINKCNDCPFKSFPSKCMSVLMHTIESRRCRMEERTGGLI